MSLPAINVEDLLSKVGKSTIFSKIEFEGAYLKLHLNEISKPLKTINTLCALFQYNRLPFGIRSAPSIFQNCMLNILSGLKGLLVNLNEILVHGKNVRQT